MWSEKPSEHITIEDLAADVNTKQQLRVKRSCSVPFAAVMIVFTVVIFSLAIIPTCVVVFTAANSATGDLSSKILNVVINLSTQVTDIFLSVKSSTDVFSQNEALRSMMSNQSTRYGTNDELNKAAQVALNASSYTEVLTCVQRFNLSGNAPPVPPPASGRLFPLQSWFYNPGFYGPAGFYVRWCDYANASSCFFLKYDSQKKAIDQQNQIETDKYSSPSQVQTGFITQKLESCVGEGAWKPEASFGFGLFTYARCGVNSDGRVTASTPYSCGAAFTSDFVLPIIFSKIAPTKNSRVFLSSNSGSLITTNLNGTIFPVTKNGTAPMTWEFVKATEFSDAVIRDIAKKLSPSGSWSEVGEKAFDPKYLNVTSESNAKPISKQYTLWDGSTWIVTVSKVSFGTSEEFYLVLGVPRDDFFGIVDRSITTGISLSSVFTALGIITGLLVTFGILIPLRKLTKNMSMVTKFDFSVLSSGGLQENSVFKEVQVVQRTFNIMVKAL
ncbi:hypothetical protein HK098_000692 [Nowakowskiella sp. JEL0407]|nr:hypothetical protein HK098_000692 [Nowakowskiella sp. JEL0407]